MKLKIRDLIYAAIGTILIIVGGMIKIPLPFIPMTLQTMMIFFISTLFKPKVAIFSSFTYVLLGLIGLPIFASGGGLGYVFNKGFGYIIGFVVATSFISKFANIKLSYIKLFIINIIGALLIYLFGITYLYIIANYYLNISMSIKVVLYYGFVTTIATDILKIIIAILLAKLVFKSSKDVLEDYDI